jgi:hypothetical protein
MWFGWAIMTLGFGLMIMLSDTSNKYIFSTSRCALNFSQVDSAEKEVFPMVAALGVGCLFQVCSCLYHGAEVNW